MAESRKKAPPPAVELPDDDEPFVVLDAQLDQPHMRALLKEHRPLMTVAQWLIVCAALDQYADAQAGTNPVSAEMADEMANRWARIVVEHAAIK